MRRRGKKDIGGDVRDMRVAIDIVSRYFGLCPELFVYLSFPGQPVLMSSQRLGETTGGGYLNWPPDNWHARTPARPELVLSILWGCCAGQENKAPVEKVLTVVGTGEKAASWTNEFSSLGSRTAQRPT